MSFNVRYGTANDGPQAWPFRRHAAFEAIRTFHPHLLGVQEALAFQVAEIEEVLPGQGRLGVGRDDGVEAGEYAAIFYDAQRLSVAEAGTFWFSDHPDEPGSQFADCYHPRICTWAIFGQGFAFYNLHLDNESGPSREKGVDILLSRLDRKVPTVVIGDFNTGEDDRCIRAMRNAGFRDSYRVLHPEGPAVTYHDFGRGGNPEKIDYVWVDERWTVLDARIVDGRIDGVWPSDHHPVAATLAL